MSAGAKLALSMTGVSKEFGEFVAVSDINLDVAVSEVICLVGPSGCGKSTLLNILAGFDHPSSGSVLVDGVAVTNPGPDRSVVFQQDALFPWLTVRKNIVAGAKALKRIGFEERATELLRQVRLEEFADRYPYQLSGGMRQRASIARALMSDLKVLLMDEPFGALDAQTRSEMQSLLQDIWLRYKPTIVFITHDIEEAVLLGDRVVVMGTGPGRMIEVIDVDFPRPRGIELTTAPKFNEIKARILELIHPEIHV